MANDKSGSEKKRHKKKLKKLYDGAIKDQQPLPAKPQEERGLSSLPVPDASGSLPQNTTDGDSQQFDPGPTFVRTWASSTLPCTSLDPATHEIWLLQLPLDWRYDAEVKLDVKRATDGPGSAMATCIDSSGDRFSVTEEHVRLASALYVVSPALKDGVPPRVQRRVTLTREDPALREVPDMGSTGKGRKSDEAAVRPADGTVRAPRPGAAKIGLPAQERGLLAPQAELRMEDILGEPSLAVNQQQEDNAQLEMPATHLDEKEAIKTEKRKKKKKAPKEES